MYTSPSMHAAEIGDFDVTVHDGAIHLHHLTLPNHDQIGHAVSTDGISFEPAPVALRTGDPGECDDDMIWTMHTVRNPANGLYHMYYTACDLANHGSFQRVALATSRDFIHWEKHPDNPICEAALPHYNEDMALLGRVAWRDPFVYIEEDGTWHMLICASASTGDRLRRGCVAHAVSLDGVEWDLHEPLYAPCQFDDLEVPSLLKLEESYYLFVHEFRTTRSVYRVADSLTGPWLAPDEDELLPGYNFVYRFCEWEGQTLLYSSYRCTADWPRRTPDYYAVLPPKQVNLEDDGSLRLSTFAGWDRYHVSGPVTIEAGSFSTFTEGPSGWQLEAGRLHASVIGQLIGAATHSFDDFILDITAQLDEGRALGLIFRADDDLESANWLRLDVVRNRVELHHLTAMDSSLNRFVRRQPSLKEAFDLPLPHGEPLRLHLVACREYIELSVNDRVVISAATYAQTQGRLGVFIENGEGWFGPATVQRIRQPASGG